MATDDWTKKSLKIQQEPQKAEYYQAGMQNALMLISSVRQPNPEDPAYRDKQLKRRYDEINNPKRPTEGQLLGESGDYLKDPETEEDISKPLQIKGMPPEINPDAHKKAQKKQKIYNKAADPEAKGAEKEWLKRTGAQLPKLLETIKPKPQDVLKILQYLPALTGGGLGQMAHVNKDGTAHSGGPEHDFMHGRRGTNTWPDGRRKYSDEELKQIDEYMKSLMISQSPAALDALRKGKAPGLSSQQIRSLIKPFTKPDQFGHPTGSLRV